MFKQLKTMGCMLKIATAFPQTEISIAAFGNGAIISHDQISSLISKCTAEHITVIKWDFILHSC